MMRSDPPFRDAVLRVLCALTTKDSPMRTPNGDEVTDPMQLVTPAIVIVEEMYRQLGIKLEERK